MPIHKKKIQGNPVSSVTRIIKHYKAEVRGKEPWHIAHEEATRVVLMEEKFGHFVRTVEALAKVDSFLYEKAIKVEEKAADAQNYRKWSGGLRAILLVIRKHLKVAESFATKVGYFKEYEDATYQKEDFTALLDRVDWMIDPHLNISEKLRSREEVVGELHRGETEPFPPGH